VEEGELRFGSLVGINPGGRFGLFQFTSTRSNPIFGGMPHFWPPTATLAYHFPGASAAGGWLATETFVRLTTPSTPSTPAGSPRPAPWLLARARLHRRIREFRLPKECGRPVKLIKLWFGRSGQGRKEGWQHFPLA